MMTPDWIADDDQFGDLSHFIIFLSTKTSPAFSFFSTHSFGFYQRILNIRALSSSGTSLSRDLNAAATSPIIP